MNDDDVAMAPHTADAANTTVTMTTAIVSAVAAHPEVIPYVVLVLLGELVGFRFEDEHSRLRLCVVIVIVAACAVCKHTAFHYIKHIISFVSLISASVTGRAPHGAFGLVNYGYNHPARWQATYGTTGR